jgi:hypothetical protein
MSEKGADPEERQSQDNMRLLRAAWCAAGLSEDAIAELMCATTADEKAAAVRARRGTREKNLNAGFAKASRFSC